MHRCYDVPITPSQPKPCRVLTQSSGTFGNGKIPKVETDAQRIRHPQLKKRGQKSLLSTGSTSF